MKTLSEQQIENIRKNPDNQDWVTFSHSYKLSEPFMREFKNKVKWWLISMDQKLSESFIIEFIDLVYIEYILSYQNHLSKEIINQLKLIKELKK